MLSVEHNNGNFLDKWPTPTNEPILRAAEEYFPDVTNPDKLPSTVKVVPDMMDVLLTLARDTDLYELWKLALTDDRNLRRYEADIPDKGGRIVLDNNMRKPVVLTE